MSGKAFDALAVALDMSPQELRDLEQRYDDLGDEEAMRLAPEVQKAFSLDQLLSVTDRLDSSPAAPEEGPVDRITADVIVG